MDNSFDLARIQKNILTEQAKNEIRVCNDTSEHFGLTLSETDITELVECRLSALKDILNDESFSRVEPIHKGWSDEKKFYVETKGGEKLLLRVSDISKHEVKKTRV